MDIFDLTKTAPISKNNSQKENEKINFIDVENTDKNNSDTNGLFFSPYFLFPYICPNQLLFYLQYHPIPNTEEKNYEIHILEKINSLQKLNFIFVEKNRLLKIYSPEFFKSKNKKFFVPKISDRKFSEIIFSNFPKVKKVIFLDKNRFFERNGFNSSNFEKNKIFEKIDNGIPILNTRLTYFGYSEKYCFNKCPYKNFCPVVV